MRKREYDPRTNRGLVSSITAGWRDEQKNMPKINSSRGKTYSGAPQQPFGPVNAPDRERDDNIMNYHAGGSPSSSRDVNLSRSMRLQNISSAVRKISEPENPKRPSFPKGVAKKVRKSMRHIFVNKAEFDLDVGDLSDSGTLDDHESTMEKDTSSQRNSNSIRDVSTASNSAMMNESSNRIEGRGRIPVLAAKLKDSQRGRSRSLKRRKEGQDTNKNEEGGEKPQLETDNTTRIRSRSEGLIGRMRRRSDEQRKRRGARGSVSPKRTSMPTAPPNTPRKRSEASPFRHSTGTTTSDVARAALALENVNSSRSLLEEAQMASEIFNQAKKRDTEEKERTLSTHSSRMGSDYFPDPAQGGGDGSLRDSSRMVARIPWGSNEDGTGSSRHSRTVAEIIMEASSGSLAVSSPYRPQILSDNSLSHGLTAARLNTLTEDNLMDTSSGSIPHLSPFSSVNTIQSPFPNGGAPYFPSEGQIISPLQSEDGEEQQPPSPAGTEKPSLKSDHRRKTSSSKSRHKNNLHASDSQLRYTHTTSKSSSRQSKDPIEGSHRTRRQRGKLSASDRTHDVRRSRLTKEESNLRRSLQAERSGGYGTLLEKQTYKPSPPKRGSSRRRKTSAGMDSSGESHLKHTKRTSKSANDRSSKLSNGNNTDEAGGGGTEKRRRSASRKSRRQRSKSKTRSKSEGERYKSMQKSKSSKSLKQKLEGKASSDNEQDSLEWSRAVESEQNNITIIEQTKLEMQRALNPNNVENAALPKMIADINSPRHSNEGSGHNKKIQVALNRSNLENAALPFDDAGLDNAKLGQHTDLAPDDIAPSPRSYHPRTEPLAEGGSSDKPISKSYHGGSEGRSKTLTPKESTKKERSESAKRKKKKKHSTPTSETDGKDWKGVDLTSLDPGQVKALLRSHGLEGKDLNEADLTALDPAQVKALLRGGNNNNNKSSSRVQEFSGGSGETRRKSRRPSSRSKRTGSERAKSRSSSKKAEEDKRSRSRKQQSSRNMDYMTEHEASSRQKKNVREYGKDEIQASFTESWCQFGEEVGFG